MSNKNRGKKLPVLWNGTQFNSMKIDIYWNNSGVKKLQYKDTVKGSLRGWTLCKKTHQSKIYIKAKL